MPSRAPCPPGCGCRKHAARARSRTPWPEWRLAPCGTPAAYRRHRRHGEQPCVVCLQAERARTSARYGFEATALSPDWREIRNGIPVRLYVYRGTGRDILEDSCE